MRNYDAGHGLLRLNGRGATTSSMTDIALTGRLADMGCMIPKAQHMRRFGHVSAVRGMLIEAVGLSAHMAVGSRLWVQTKAGGEVACEIVGQDDGRSQMMAFAPMDGIGLGCAVYEGASQPCIYPTQAWLGRVIDGLGEPVDGCGPLPHGTEGRPIKAKPPRANERQRVGPMLDLGVRALNSFAALCQGQRMGIFAGSGVGKSVLMSMLARYTDADVIVLGLIGERGREVQEFLQDDLGPEGLARSVVVVATSDEPALSRRQAAYMTLSIAEYFRDQGLQVLCLMDSVTRFAMAQREIGLAAGEPPASKGYTPTVFAELPKLLERAGPGSKDCGAITGLFTVLVEGDDHNEPVADAVRGILDGHIVMDRTIAERGRYPAVDVLRSVSRTMPHCHTPEQQALIKQARQALAIYADMEELIRLGAYRRGADAAVDRAINLNDPLQAFLAQDKQDCTSIADGFDRLAAILARDST